MIPASSCSRSTTVPYLLRSFVRLPSFFRREVTYEPNASSATFRGHRNDIGDLAFVSCTATGTGRSSRFMERRWCRCFAPLRKCYSRELASCIKLPFIAGLAIYEAASCRLCSRILKYLLDNTNESVK